MYRLVILGMHKQTLFPVISPARILVGTKSYIPILNCISPELNIVKNALCSLDSQQVKQLHISREQSPYKPHPLAALATINKYTHTNDLVLDMQYPGIDGYPSLMTKVQFSIPYNVPSSDKMYIRGLRPIESMRLYIGHLSCIKEVELHRIFASSDKRIVLSAVLPIKSAAVLCEVFATNIISPLLHYKDNNSINTVSCMVAQPLPSADDWTEAYQKDHDTSYILKLLQSKVEFSEKGLRILSAAYMHPLPEKRVKLLSSRIVIMNPIGSAIRFLTLIVVPKDIRHIIFHAYHTTPIGAQMGRYKILLLIR